MKTSRPKRGVFFCTIYSFEKSESVVILSIMKWFKHIYNFFDKLEDHVRAWLSKHQILYAIIGGICVVLFWRGVWLLADSLSLSGWVSFTISIAILLVTGLFVSSFVGDVIILSGLKKESKLSEKTLVKEDEEKQNMQEIARTVESLEEKMDMLLSKKGETCEMPEDKK